jgi:hypothetical protein
MSEDNEDDEDIPTSRDERVDAGVNSGKGHVTPVEYETENEDGEASGEDEVDEATSALMSALDSDIPVDPTAFAANMVGSPTAVESDAVTRQLIARHAGFSHNRQRDYYGVLGYDRTPVADDYYVKYLRNDIARTIVDKPAEASWKERPLIIDDADEGGDDEDVTEFEEAVNRLFTDHRLLHYLKRADKATGVGEYGLLLLGLRDGEKVDLSTPASESDYRSLLDTDDATTDDDLAYIGTFTQASVTSMDINRDPTNPRYGLPEQYQIQFESGDSHTTEFVHHTRVVHIAENLLENEIFGRPRLEPVLNRLEDLEKVLGGSAEMFWRGADRKLQLNYMGDGKPRDSDKLQTRSEELIHGMRNILPTSNTEVNEIGGEEVDPSGIVEQELKHIAGAVGIPLRMLTGSERGELASTQDRATFYERIASRREQFCEPKILRPTLDKLIRYGILPKPKGGGYTVEWTPLFELNELERAELMAQKAKALKDASPMGDPAQVATTSEIRSEIFGWSPERGSEVEATDDTLDEDMPDEDEGDENDQLPEDIADLDDLDDEDMREILDDLDDAPLDGIGDENEAYADGGENDA